MKWIVAVAIVGMLSLYGVMVAYADSSIYLPIITNGVEAQPEAPNQPIRAGDTVRLTCTGNGNRLVIAEQTDTSIYVTCVAAADHTPTSTPTLAPTATSTDAPKATPTSTPAATSTSVPANNPQPLGQSGEWNLVFNDEFEGTSLDLSKWEPSWFAGNGISKPVNTDEDGCYSASQVAVSDGMLNLRADTIDNPDCVRRDNTRVSYVSGLVNTRKGFAYTYGYIEARIFLPGSNGDIWNWPAWWSAGFGPWPENGEIDVVEGLSSHRPCWHYHYEDSDGEHQAPGGCSNIDGTGWHTYGAYWERDKVTYYYDGQQVGQITEGIIDTTHYLILNYGINDRYGINVPATMQADYVRVWKR